MERTLGESSAFNEIEASFGRIQTPQDQAALNEQLAASNERLMSANEELVFTNDEFQSTNEELQSINGELETSRQELQALNKELITVNAQLRDKVEELNRANSDMENLLSASQIATAFLDQQLNIKRFTPSMAAIFGLTPSDIGRAFQILGGKIDWPDFPGDANKVLEELIQIEREVEVPESEKCYIMRVLPYRTAEGGTDGIVVTLIDVTERKRTEEALRRARDEWERTFDSVPDLIAILDKQHRILRVNSSMARRIGMEPRDCIGLTCYSVVHGTEKPPVQCPHTMAMADGLERGAEVRDERLGGDFKVSITPLLDSQGEITGAVHVALDITERRRAEDQIKTQAAHLRALMDNLPFGLWAIGPDGQYFMQNSIDREVWGNIVGKRPQEWAPYQEVLDRWMEDNRRAFAGEVVKKETEHLFRGEKRLFYKILAPIVHEETILGIMGVNIDITDRRRSEEALRQSEERWEFAIEGSNDGVWDRNLQTGEVYFSRQWKEMLGFRDEEISANVEEWSERVHPEDHPCVREALRKHFRGQTPHYSAEYRIRCKDGFYKWILARGKVISRTEEGKPVRFIGTHTDISERKNLETQLYQAQKMEAIGQLAGGVAHDFNNILTAIIGFSHLIMMKAAENEPLRNYVGHIRASAERAAELTQALLTFSREQVMVQKVVNLNQIVTQLEKMLRRLIRETLELRLEIFSKSLYIMADRGKIEQLLINLVTNARDAMPGTGIICITTSKKAVSEGSPRPLGTGAQGECAFITVSDTGCGMNEETKKKIFEPFFTTKEVGKGTGLGLSIVYGIVKQHNGSIFVDSEPSRGTSISICLPLVNVNGDEIDIKDDTPPTGGTETILLAEDDPEVRDFHSTLLEAAGYTLVLATDGEEALEEFARLRGEIDILVLDVIMPKFGGRKVYDAITRARPGIKVLFLSGYPADDFNDAEIVHERGDLLTKPVNPDDLLKKVREILNRKE